MRNPERTTKAERRAAKQWNPLAARTLGIARAARYMRAGVLLDEAGGLDQLFTAMCRPLEEITEVRADSPELPEALRPAVEAFVNGQNGDPVDYTVAYRASDLDGDAADILILPKWEKGGVLEDYARQYGGEPVVDLAAPTHTGYEVGPGPNPHITLKYPPHVSFIASVPYRNGKHHVDGLAEAWRQYRERHDPAEYADWDGDPWRDPNEVAAVRAEAIESALADDFDDEDGHHG